LCRLYEAIWYYASLPDLLSILKSVLLSQVLIAGCILFWHLPQYPRSVLIIQPLLAVAFLCTTRLALRFTRAWRMSQYEKKKIRSLLVGDGDLMENTLRVLHQVGL
jgi:FlaA1/EpsC-like NDP-sugar epimerase